MKKWLKFFCFSFFSHKWSKEGARRGYINFFLSFILALTFLWMAFVGGDMLPFYAHYDNSPDFAESVRSIFANTNPDKRVKVEIENGILKVKDDSGEYIEGIIINTFMDSNQQEYSTKGYNIIVDTHSADTLAEVEAFCVSNDGTNTVVSYQDYLGYSDAVKYKFDFKLRYTGNELVLNDEMVKAFREYVDGTSEENKLATESLTNDLSTNKITQIEYNRAIYELYFTNYYPEITAYESSSKVPLLRNYYYHQYISEGENKYLFVFNDCMVGAFETQSGIDVSFYGFYSELANGPLIADGMTQEKANETVDNFIKKSFGAITPLNLYSQAINTIALVPFIVLMPMVVALLAYSIFKLRGIESITSLGATFKVAGSFMWFSSIVATVFSVILSLFVPTNLVTALPLVSIFVVLLIRMVIFVVVETKLYMKQIEQRMAEQTEV